MANRNQPHTAELIAFVAAFPAEVLAMVRPTGRGSFVATVDVGPKSYVSDADMPEYAATAQEACEKVKLHLLDDLACGGQLGKRHYQPHWDAYDIRYRLGQYWTEKQASLAEGATPCVETAAVAHKKPQGASRSPRM